MSRDCLAFDYCGVTSKTPAEGVENMNRKKKDVFGVCILAESQLGPWTGSTVSAEERVLPSAVIHFAASACCAAYFRIFA